jgi:integrase
MPRVALTDRFVARIKPDKHGRTDYFDEVTTGLALRIGEGGHRSWCFHFTSPKDGRRARYSMGTYPATSLSRARALAIEAKGFVEAGQDPRDVFAAKDAAAMTVANLVTAYLDKHVKPNLRTADALKRRFTKNVLPIIGSVKLADLHKRDVNRVTDPILARDAAMEATRVFEDLRAMLRWAVARGDLDHNSMEGMRKPAESEARERVLSDDEIRLLWNGLPSSLARSKQCQRIIKLCLVTAQRIGEVAGMRKDELDLKACVWSLPGARTKNGYPHAVPLSSLALSVIKEAISDAGKSAFVFPAEEGPLPPHAVARTIGRAQEADEERPEGRFGIAHWTAHDLRRTALTGMAKLGMAPIVLGHVANHRTTTKAGVTLGVYIQHGYQKEVREALELWADRLSAVIAGDTAADIVPMRRRS